MPTTKELRARAQRSEAETDGRDGDTSAALATITTVRTPAGRPVWYPPDAILTDDEVADVLGVSVKTVRKWGIRRAVPSPTLPRYLFRDVVAFINDLAA